MTRALAATTVVIALLAVMVAASAPAVELKVIVHPSVTGTEISLDELKAIFLGTRAGLKQGGRLQPVLVKAGPSLTTLAREFLGKTEAGLETYYRSLAFSGRWSIPPTLESDSDVAAYVAKTPGTIACIDASVPAAGTKVLRLKAARRP